MGLSFGWDNGPVIILFLPTGITEHEVYPVEFSFDKYMGKRIKWWRFYFKVNSWKSFTRRVDYLRTPIGYSVHIPGDGWKVCGICGELKYYHDTDGLNCPDFDTAKAFHEQGKKDMKESEDTGKPKIIIWDAGRFNLETTFQEVNIGNSWDK